MPRRLMDSFTAFRHTAKRYIGQCNDTLHIIRQKKYDIKRMAACNTFLKDDNTASFKFIISVSYRAYLLSSRWLLLRQNALHSPTCAI